MELDKDFSTKCLRTIEFNINQLAERLRAEGSGVVTNCHRLKLSAENMKIRKTED